MQLMKVCMWVRRFSWDKYMDLVVFFGTAAAALFTGGMMAAGGIPLHRNLYTMSLIGSLIPLAFKCHDIACNSEVSRATGEVTQLGKAMKRWHWMSIPCGVAFVLIPLFYGF